MATKRCMVPPGGRWPETNPTTPPCPRQSRLVPQRVGTSPMDRGHPAELRIVAGPCPQEAREAMRRHFQVGQLERPGGLVAGAANVGATHAHQLADHLVR